MQQKSTGPAGEFLIHRATHLCVIKTPWRTIKKTKSTISLAGKVRQSKWLKRTRQARRYSSSLRQMNRFMSRFFLKEQVPQNGFLMKFFSLPQPEDFSAVPRRWKNLPDSLDNLQPLLLLLLTSKDVWDAMNPGCQIYSVKFWLKKIIIFWRTFPFALNPFAKCATLRKFLSVRSNFLEVFFCHFNLSPLHKNSLYNWLIAQCIVEDDWNGNEVDSVLKKKCLGLPANRSGKL